MKLVIESAAERNGGGEVGSEGVGMRFRQRKGSFGEGGIILDAGMDV